MVASFAFPPPEVPALRMAGTGALFPVRRVWCVGQNYTEHVREMGGGADTAADAPIFFAKSAHSVLAGGSPVRVPYPPATRDFHYEVELVLALGPGAGVFGCAVGLDMTRRDLQSVAKARGQPWAAAKDFDCSAPIGPITRGPPPGAQAAITLSVNGKVRQSATLGQMVWDIPAILAALARLVALGPGDLIFTGTPAGVGPVVPGDRVRAEVGGLPPLEVEVAS